MKKVYLSGPVSAIPERYRKIFKEAGTLLRRKYAGHIRVVSPVMKNPPADYALQMSQALRKLAGCDAMIYIQVYHESAYVCVESNGQDFEYLCAQRDVKPIFRLPVRITDDGDKVTIIMYQEFENKFRAFLNDRDYIKF